MLALVDLEERVPRNHPLRLLKEFAERAVRQLSPIFAAMCAAWWPIIHPARATAHGVVADFAPRGAQRARLLFIGNRA